MTTLLNSPLTPGFDHVGTFTPPNPLLQQLGVDQLMMLRMLRDHCPEFAFVLKRNFVEAVDAKDICEGKGFMSHIVRVSIHFANPGQPPFSFVLKIPTTSTVDAIIDSLSDNDRSGGSAAPAAPHDAECRFYEAFSDSSDFFPLPRVYYANPESSVVGPRVIFMDDLSSRGSCVDVFDSLTEAQCVQVAESMARLQTHFDHMDVERRRAVTINQCVHTTPEKQQFLDEFLSRIGDYGQDFVHLVGQLKSVANVEFAQFALIDQPHALGCQTLVHGDTWTNNVLFSVDEPDRLCALIDWQTAFQGNPMFDIALLLASSTNAEVRRACSTRLVDRYYDVLTAAHLERGSRPRFTRSQAHQLFSFAQLVVAPLLGALLCFFGRSLSLSDLEATILRTNMAVIVNRTRAVLKDAITLLPHVEIPDFKPRS